MKSDDKSEKICVDPSYVFGVEGGVIGDFRANMFVASRSISRYLGLMLLAMTNGWPDTAFEESVLLGKLGVYCMSVIPLACHVP